MLAIQLPGGFSSPVLTIHPLGHFNSLVVLLLSILPLCLLPCILHPSLPQATDPMPNSALSATPSMLIPIKGVGLVRLLRKEQVFVPQ